MRSIESRFREIREKKSNQNLGTYPCLVQAIIYRKFSRKSLVKNFKKLMPKDEYLKSETKGLISYLEELTNKPEEVEKRDKIALCETNF